MEMMNKLKGVFLLFLTMLKIGLFTFGGGYAMIHLLDNEFVTKKNWLTSDEFIDLVAIAESTPGPIAINCSTYIGYKTYGFLGSFFATVGVCIPSFVIIFVISLFFDQFMELELVSAAFKGIQSCVIFLILSAGFKMFKKLTKNIINIAVLICVLVCMILFSLLAINFSSIFYILISAIIGIATYSISFFKHRKSSDRREEADK